MADTASALPWHLRGNWAPLLQERQLPASGRGIDPAGAERHLYPHRAESEIGKLPALVPGRRDGARHPPRNGKAEWHRNRFVQTPNITDPVDARSLRRANWRAARATRMCCAWRQILCLNESSWPWLIDQDLNTLGCQNYDGALTCSMTAHPKVCPETGELLAFSYFAFAPPFLHYIRMGADGQLKQMEGIDIPNMVMMHDFSITRNHVIFMDLPLLFKPQLIASGIPYQFDASAGARLGVMPRKGGNRTCGGSLSSPAMCSIR